ncbi:Type I restriction-modification system, restriction subunit R [hydrothermal vent metagenome]|uniref:Type I restriction-modification system, restriction subunit R n=1 Tax=hydrothermal vent metagenome TaxID=652676 RepID=A0A3B0U110_9ZZZZ
MTRITENTIEEFAIELLERLGYQYIYAPDIAHDLPVRGTQTGGERPERNIIIS